MWLYVWWEGVEYIFVEICDDDFIIDDDEFEVLYDEDLGDVFFCVF